MIVLLRWRDAHPEPTADSVTVHALLENEEALQRRLESIRSKNPYELRPLGTDLWVMGPEEDEGFFGDKPVYFRAVRKDVIR